VRKKLFGERNISVKCIYSWFFAVTFERAKVKASIKVIFAAFTSGKIYLINQKVLKIFITTFRVGSFSGSNSLIMSSFLVL